MHKSSGFLLRVYFFGVCIGKDCREHLKQFTKAIIPIAHQKSDIKLSGVKTFDMDMALRTARKVAETWPVSDTK